MAAKQDFDGNIDIDFLHQLGTGLFTDPLPQVLSRIVVFVSSLVKCDSCFIYILEGQELVLRASRNVRAESIGRVRVPRGKGITGWVAEHKRPVVISRKASEDPRFLSFNELPEDRYEAFLSVPVLCREKLVGIINVQHRQPHSHTRHEIQLISTIGFLVGAEVELARLENENWTLSQELALIKHSGRR
jgi:signal transduction protein with GAF and PtsI domain